MRTRGCALGNERKTECALSPAFIIYCNAKRNNINAPPQREREVRAVVYLIRTQVNANAHTKRMSGRCPGVDKLTNKSFGGGRGVVGFL